MTRTTRYKVAYGVLVAVLGGIAVVVLNAFSYSLAAVLVTALVLMIPGRIQGHYWREFFQARRLIADRRWREAEPLFQHFLDRVEREPSLKRFIWLGYGVYTRDIAAMALNNLGVCALEEGRFGAAETHLNRAAMLDLEYAVPHFNLAIVYQALGKTEAAQRAWSRSQELGYRRTPIDLVVHKAGEVLARIEGRGVGPAHGAA